MRKEIYMNDAQEHERGLLQDALNFDEYRVEMDTEDATATIFYTARGSKVERVVRINRKGESTMVA